VREDEAVIDRTVVGPDGREARLSVEQRRDLARWTVRVARDGSPVAETTCHSETETLQAFATYRMMVAAGDL
jgi:hypothetical protein